MLPSPFPRVALFACHPSPSWNLPFFTVETNVSFTSICPDPLCLAKVRLSLTLTLSHLTIWYSEEMALFLFFLAKAALAYLLTALFVALRPLFSFRHAQYAQVFLLKPAPFCKLFAGLGSTKNLPLLLFFPF